MKSTWASTQPANSLRNSLILLLLLSVGAQAQSKKTRVLHFVEHVALGAGVEISMSYAAGGPRKYPAGLLAAGLVAGFKESADAIAGRDTPKRAAFHAFSIMLGAGAVAAIKH